ncbi:FkbM family methyltransferase [Yoonia sp. F2084L]|nr:FkbM family methyltransferase [Yoonia sp. F2084L]
MSPCTPDDKIRNRPISQQDIQRIKLLRDLVKPQRLTRIVDVGASPINPAPYDMLLDAGLAEVTGFEPQPDPFEDLQNNPIPNRTVLPYAVGNGEDGILNVCRASGFTSLLKANEDFLTYAGRWRAMMRVVEHIPVQTQRLMTLLKFKILICSR